MGGKISAIIRDLRELPTGVRVFIDTNIFDLYFRQKSITCVDFFRRIQQGEITAYVNLLLLTDLTHKLMLAKAYQKGYINRLNAAQLKDKLEKNRSLIQHLATYYQTRLEEVLALVKILPLDSQLLVDTQQERHDYGLMTTDSLHLGNMNRHQPLLTHIVTDDSDFEHISGLTIWKPMDVI